MAHRKTATTSRAGVVNRRLPGKDNRSVGGHLSRQPENGTLIKELNVKGVNFTAKRATVVRVLSLVADNPEHIEDRVSGQQIVILIKFFKRAN